MSLLNNLRVLCLNSDYVPLNTTNWKKAITKTICEQTASVVEYYDDIYIMDSKGHQYFIPAVIVNKKHIHKNYRRVLFSKKNILRRDRYYCQYCYKKFEKQHLTLDHIIPRSKWDKKLGTPTCWTNTVACCLKCNSKKADRTLEKSGMRLGHFVDGDRLVFYTTPKHPSYSDMVLALDYDIPEQWLIYLSSIKNRNKIEIPQIKV